MNELRQCTGCGATMQADSPETPGYLPADALHSGSALCRRCFRMRNYGEFSSVSVSPDQYVAELACIVDRPGTVLYVLDVFDLAGSLVSNLARYTVGSRVAIVVNKTDVLPREVQVDRLRDWVERTVTATGIQPVAVFFVSAERNRGIDALAAWLEAQAESVVYSVGMANVGKSTLLNRLVSRWGNGAPFTVSRVPGTTLAAVGAEVVPDGGRALRLVDTPGLIRGERATDLLCVDCLKAAVPKDSVHPRVYQLDPGQSLWLGGFVRFDFEAGRHQPIVCYVGNALHVHRTKRERAAAIYHERADAVLATPCAACRARLGQHRPITVTAGSLSGAARHDPQRLLVARSGSDIVLAGLGWITLQGTDLRGRVWAPGGLAVTVRPKLVGGLASATRHGSGRRR